MTLPSRLRTACLHSRPVCSHTIAAVILVGLQCSLVNAQNKRLSERGLKQPSVPAIVAPERLEPVVQPVDQIVPDLCTVLVVEDGILVVHDAALPADALRENPGYIAYWRDHAEQKLYVYGQLLFEPGDVEAALAILERDLDVETAELAEGVYQVKAEPRRRAIAPKDGIGEAELPPEDGAEWVEATYESLFWVMGFDSAWVSNEYPGMGGIAQQELPCASVGPPPAPLPCGQSKDHTRSPDELIHEAVIIACGGGGGGGGGDTCNTYCCWHPCACNPCCANPCSCDPCCGDPCCGDPCCNDRCCQGSPCCESPDPCCNLSDPCCGNSDRCCNDDNPCCESPDPCCNVNDECCGDPDPCCNPDNPCCNDPVCCGDPCCLDPCSCNACAAGCGHDDPCDQLCGDPCLCMNCDDDEPCTNDGCSSGSCWHEPKCEANCCPPDWHCCDGPCCGDGCCLPEPNLEYCCNEALVVCCDSGSPAGGAVAGTAREECCVDRCCQTGWTCCGGTDCCDPQFCCDNGECCAETCEGCTLDNGLPGNGTLDGTNAVITVTPNPPIVCVGDSIIFSISGVIDSGGVKRVNCSAKQHLPGQGVTYEWTLTLPSGYPTPLPPLTGTGDTVNVVAKVAGVYSCSFTAKPTRTDCPPAPKTIGPATGTSYSLEITTPNDDPTTTTGANATNERTYTTAASPVLTVPCVAGSVPDPSKLRWRIDDAGSIRATWVPHVSGDPYTGTGASPTATYTGMPTDNSAFGAKTITLTMDGSSCTDSQVVELFFPKLATNHPGGQAGSPNWFCYWRQAVGNPPNLVHEAGAGLYGHVKAMVFWNYAIALAPKTEITINDLAAGVDPGCFENTIHGAVRTTGIATFWDTIVHEGVHVTQIAAADPLVGTAPGTPWEKGWSWNRINDNHWGIGADGKPGRVGVDDDSDGTVDNLHNTGPGELGHYDVQTIPVGQGKAHQLCVGVGANGVRDTSAAADDVATASGVQSGPNGICQTAAVPDDTQTIPLGNGSPGSLCVSPGGDGQIDTGTVGDDAIVGASITSGSDGVCQSIAGHPNPSDDADLETVLPSTDWPDAWGSPPPPPHCQGHPLEHQPTEAEPDDDTLFSTLDWGDPGKNHRTIGKYDD